ncbi:MAG: glycine--tRNA ligase [Deltaproteobacteria bacterium]|nr:glycine--tRNA ligase [Deltaproteobacteria bacterium]
MEKIVSLAKRRGFVFQSSEIYGGLNGCWDYGPVGVELKNNVKREWWRSTVTERDDMAGVDCSILMHPRVWEASGHVSGFSDPMVDCKTCKGRFREDHLAESQCPKKPSKAPGQHDECQLTEARKFNLMFKTFVGPMEDTAAQVYLRPETAQGIFVNFKNVLETSRQKIPFGIAQIGKSFRNEITPKQFTFRVREFEQMEIEFFCKPGSDEEWYNYWKDARFNWYVNLGIRKENLRLRAHEADELAHYARGCSDVEYLFPFGWSELEGIANRTDFDLRQHQQFSGKSLEYTDPQSRERFVPYVIEPSAGADRGTLAFLVDAYAEDTAPDEKGQPETRIVMRFHPRIAPVKAAVFPLTKKDGMPEMADRLYRDLKKRWNVDYDLSGSIGKRYRRQDEIGTPFGITVDADSVKDGTVTVRDRDTMKQERVAASGIIDYLGEKLS